MLNEKERDKSVISQFNQVVLRVVHVKDMRDLVAESEGRKKNKHSRYILEKQTLFKPYFKNG